MKRSLAFIPAAVVALSLALNVSAIELPFVPVDYDPGVYDGYLGNGEGTDPNENEEFVPRDNKDGNGSSPENGGGSSSGNDNDGSLTPIPPDGSTTDPDTNPTDTHPEQPVTPPSGGLSPGYGNGSYVIFDSHPAYVPAQTAVSGSTSENGKTLDITARTDSKGNVVLEWEKVRKADKYTVYIYSDKKWKKVGSTKGNTYTYKNAQSGKKYRFMVRYTAEGATSGVNESFRITVSVNKADAKPVVTAVAKDGKVTLRWRPVQNADKYNVYRVVDGKLKKVTTTTKTAVRITQRSADTGYAVKACVNGKWTTVTKKDIVIAVEE